MSVLTPFNPAPEIIDALIDELGDPDCTLRDIANEHKTTLEALTLWLTRDDIAARLNNIESAVCRRTRLIATNFMPCVARLCTIIVSNHFEDEHELDPGPVTNEPRRRSRDGARKAGALLLRLARLFPLAAPPRPKLDASMPHASMPSSASPSGASGVTPPSDERPHAPKLVTQPLNPDRRNACPTNGQAAAQADGAAIASGRDLSNLVAQTSGLCPSRSTSSPPTVRAKSTYSPNAFPNSNIDPTNKNPRLPPGALINHESNSITAWPRAPSAASPVGA